MKILFLYNNPCANELADWIESLGHLVFRTSEKLSIEWCLEQQFDLTVSYTYRYIISKELIDALKNNVVNIHNSFLPWNRGADPNMWSIIDNTPRGVTLHYINAGLDKGLIIAQRLLGKASDNATLKSTYEELDSAAKELFKDAFDCYECWDDMKKSPIGVGSYHSLESGEEYKKLFDTYDISIKNFRSILEKH